MELLFFLWLACGIIGALIGQTKGRKTEGLLLGFFLALIGIVIVIFMDPLPAGKAPLSLAKALLIIVILVGIGLAILIPALQKAEEREDTERMAKEVKEGLRESAEAKKEHAEEIAEKRTEWEATPKTDRFGFPLNITPPPELRDAAPALVTTPIPSRTPTPQEMVAKQARAAAQQAAEIARKYGSH